MVCPGVWELRLLSLVVRLGPSNPSSGLEMDRGAQIWIDWTGVVRERGTLYAVEELYYLSFNLLAT